MKKIFKYEINIADTQSIEMPGGSYLISAKEQSGNLCIWAVVDQRNRMRQKNIRVVGTGQDVDFIIGEYNYEFIDTVLMSNGLVWHIFSDMM